MNARSHLAPAGAAAPHGRLPMAALVALACSTFISVTIEMLPTGLMHRMAPDLGVSNAAIGMLMTVFAFTVVISSTPITHLTRRLPRHTVLVVVLTIFAIGSIGTALAPTYELVVVTRILTGLAHGVFWAVVASYTSLIAPREQLTKAISITLGGGSAAYVLGVPIGTFLGDALGWRMAFGGLAVLALLVAVTLWLLLPRVDHLALQQARTAPQQVQQPAIELELQPAPTGPIAIQTEYGTGTVEPSPASGARAEPAQSLARVAMICVLTFTIMLAQYAAYSYISPFVIDEIGIGAGVLAFVLFGYGIASALGTLLTGMLFQERRTTGFLITFALMFGGVAILAFAPPTWLAIAALVVWGIGMGFMPPLLQTTLLLVAPRRLRDVSSALYTSGFNLGIGSGALVGGWILEGLGLGYIMPFFLVVIAIGFAGWASVMVRRRRAVARGTAIG
ncbi:chloramphenicol resistance protein [Pseudoclavibacter endophyticus]|uniref:MFS transporter n=1 Tax=Pseudoclavibacter endophyticus TaxID=1778590 RepID=A0A6H9WSN1_9MICO|nr:MFS transporter [Pseudoclavibacter endophyticus]KAB1649354.1 MFS transporter [Pseudoclavibacter endophyticus]GGA63247.1 chloramphenicol resistance protein [Pseudoclavibacter endophyticus]